MPKVHSGRRHSEKKGGGNQCRFSAQVEHAIPGHSLTLELRLTFVRIPQALFETRNMADLNTPTDANLK